MAEFSSLTALLGTKTTIDVVDIGASPVDGPPPYENLRKSCIARVVGFEPNPEALAKIKANSPETEIYLPYAVGDGRTHELHYCPMPGMNSLLLPNFELLSFFHGFPEWSRVLRSESVETKRLDDIAEVAAMDYLKIDVQGAELMVLEGAVKKLRACLVVHTEVEFLPMYQGQPLFSEIELFLRAQGFVPHKIYTASRTIVPLMASNDIRANAGQLLYADAVFVRDFTRLDELSSDQLLKLAVILHDVYHSADFAFRLLHDLDRRAGSDHGERFAKAIGIV